MEIDFMKKVPYHAMLCTRSNICYAISIVSHYQSNPRPEHRVAMKYIVKHLQRMRDCILIYLGHDLNPFGYTDFDFQFDCDSRKSKLGSVFTLEGGVVIWKSIK